MNEETCLLYTFISQLETDHWTSSSFWPRADDEVSDEWTRGIGDRDRELRTRKCAVSVGGQTVVWIQVGLNLWSLL